LYGRSKTAQKANEQKELENQARIDQAETKRASKLNQIQQEITRWDEWRALPSNYKEVNLFEDNPDYFIDLKLPNASDEIKNDKKRLITKLYDPSQFDKERAKKSVEAKYKKSMEENQEKYNAAKLEMESSKWDPNSAKFRKLKAKVAELDEKVKFQQYNIDFSSELLPYDSIYAIRLKPDSTNTKNEYFVIIQNADGSYKEKLVAKKWLQENLEKEFWDKFLQSEQEKSWVLFNRFEAQKLVAKDDVELRKLLDSNNVMPMYVYQRKEEDDKIECVRVTVEFKHPYKNLVPSSIKWAIMTEKNSGSEQSMEKMRPWNGIEHVYWNCSETLLQMALGFEFMDLIRSACKEIWTNKFKNQGHPFNKPKLIFSDPPRVEFVPNEQRFIDDFDLSKSSFLKKKPRVFEASWCGIFSNRQYYYFDMREFATTYYVNVSTRQISGINYNQSTKEFVGLEKYREKGVSKYRTAPLDKQWLQENVSDAVIKAAVQRAKESQYRFVKIPVGLAREIQTSKDIQKNPVISYPQYGEDSCVFSSLSSALHYLKYEDVALQVDEFKNEFYNSLSAFNFETITEQVVQFLQTTSYQYFRKECEIQRILNPQSFDLIDHCTRKPNILYHVVLISEDGGENHAICVVHGWIFDGNYTNARRLSKANLNASCDSTFIGIASGYKYTFFNE
jgi:hypothetical protein